MSILDDAFAIAARSKSSILIDGNLTSVHPDGLVTSIYQPSPSVLGGAPATYNIGPPAALQFDFENIHYFRSDGSDLPPAYRYASITLTQTRHKPRTAYAIAVMFWDGSHVAPALNIRLVANVDAESGVVYGSGDQQPFVTLLITAVP